MCPFGSEHCRKGITTTLVLAVIFGALQMIAPRAAADISDSFEGGLGPWQGNMNYDWAFFDVSLSSIYAYDGIYSVKMQAHGLPQPTYPKMTVWIERQVRVPASTTMDAGVNFYVYNENVSYAPEEVLVYFGDAAPLDYPDFTLAGMTDQAIGWKYFQYQTTVTTSPSGWLWVAIGFYNSVTGFKFYFFDMVTITGVSDDWTPPAITNLQPLNQTMISDNTPSISASYSDASGIDTSTVMLKVDSTDVTGWATVTPADISYTPSTAMAEGVHNVYLEVRDNCVNHNRAVATWWFRVDSVPPLIVNLAPANHSTVSTTTPAIGAGYSDANGVNVSLVVLKVDSVDVTTSATVLATSIDYTPAVALSQGLHAVYLSASDKSNPPNTAVAIWQFTVDSLGPIITNLRPADLSTTSDNTPLIAADYDDPSSIDTTSVQLRVDGVDVISSAFVTLTYITYTPSAALTEGDHTVFLYVRDDSPGHNFGMAQWTFTIDSLAPTITNLRPADASLLSDSTPLIAADYFDSSGIATSAVVLEVDSVNVTSQAIVTANAVTYAPAISLPDGSHNIHVSVRDDSPNHLLAETSWAFRTDTTPPTTTLQVLSPSYTDSGTGRTYISSLTMLRLTASDGSGSGVQSIRYLYYASGESPPTFSTYSSEFSVPSSKADGLIFVKFKSTDTLGNAETEQTIQLYLDNTVPTADAPGYSDTAITYTNNALAVVTIDAADSGSGVGEIKYGVDNSACPTTYSSPVPMNAAGEGEHRIHYTAVDRVGNAATVRFAWIYLDTTPPTPEAGEDQQVNLGTLVSFDGTASTDTGSGIENYTWSFTYEDDIAIIYGPQPKFRFDTRGVYDIELRVRDKAGNSATDTMRVTFNEGGGAGGVSGEFPWWAVVLAVIIIAFLLTMFLLMAKRKKKEEEEPAKKPVSEQSAAATIECPSCGKMLTPEEEFCSKCGTPMKAEEEVGTT